MIPKLFLSLCLFCIVLAPAEKVLTANSRCQSKCGDLTIPYPFGVGTDCSIGSWAAMECYTRSNPPKLFLKDSSYEVVEVSITEVRVKNKISNMSTSCFNGYYSSYESFLDYNSNPFSFSSKNKFTVFGCNMTGIGEWTAGSESSFVSGCRTSCSNHKAIVGGRCEGTGSCQISIPAETKEYYINVYERNRSSSTGRANSSCGSGFLADETYKFMASDIKTTTVVLDFTVGNKTCDEASTDPSSLACRENSDCITVGSRHICNCSKGYEGNPYLTQGCQDVNECKNRKNTCTGRCFNTQGSYRCFPLLGIIIIGLILALLLLLGGGLGIYSRKQRQLREKHFQQNGGLLLQEKISLHVGGGESTKIFTSNELKHATNNYDESRVLGEGGFGKVYKGVLPDLRVVAIKKSKIIDKDQLEQFINEVDILTQINHRNIVKLLGCCLEVELPLLVYEFVPNGTLSEHLSEKYDFLLWEDRLRIAAEIASAIAYLHSSASIPIIHRDVKSSNILLDDDLTAKVADFGASRANPLDETQISTLVKGTIGYLDPEYMLTNQLTQKSDVYSFGVILAELLTGDKPLSFQRSLAAYFTTSMKEKRLLHILQDEILNDDNTNQIQAVAELAEMCLCRSGEERPSMKKVAAELEGLRGFVKTHSSSHKGKQEQVSLHPKQAELHSSSSYTGNTFNYSDIKMVMSLKDAR